MDEQALNTGSLASLELILHGTPIADTDADGLDDDWERIWLGHLNMGPRDDPDSDGYSNAIEQVLATHPSESDLPFRIDLSRWNQDYLRLSWPGIPSASYHVLGQSLSGPVPGLITEIPGQFPVTESFLPVHALTRHQFFRVQAMSPAPASHMTP
jgi:hypothetical protein